MFTLFISRIFYHIFGVLPFPAQLKQNTNLVPSALKGTFPIKPVNLQRKKSEMEVDLLKVRLNWMGSIVIDQYTRAPGVMLIKTPEIVSQRYIHVSTFLFEYNKLSIFLPAPQISISDLNVLAGKESSNATTTGGWCPWQLLYSGAVSTSGSTSHSTAHLEFSEFRISSLSKILLVCLQLVYWNVSYRQQSSVHTS